MEEYKTQASDRNTISGPQTVYLFISLSLVAILITRIFTVLILERLYVPEYFVTPDYIIEALVSVFGFVAGILIIIHSRDFNTRRNGLLAASAVLLMLSFLSPLSRYFTTIGSGHLLGISPVSAILLNIALSDVVFLIVSPLLY